MIIDQKREITAVREARKVGIPVVCLLDSDCDPDLVDIPIPGNDDAMRAIDIVLRELCNAVEEGLRGRVAKAGEEGPRPPRRSRRPTTARATPEEEAAEAAAAGEQAPPAPEPAAPSPAPAQQPAEAPPGQ